jgi:hypothetical protein
MSSRALFLISLTIALLNLTAPAAVADLGVEKVSRSKGGPGESVKVTLGCGACLAGGRQAPASFPVSLVPAAKVPQPYRCGPRMLCAPQVQAPPKRAPFTYPGEALLRREEGRVDEPYPLYVLDFTIPTLPTGTYTYVIYCDDCLDGKGGSLISAPTVPPLWRLRIRR